MRQLNNRGSLSGSIIGGLMFGSGMTLTRACASRMLVLSATGNLRALLSGMVFAVVAQMSRDGALSQMRSAINDWWTIDSSSRDMIGMFHMGHGGAHPVQHASGWRSASPSAFAPGSASWTSLAAAGVGLMVAAAWAFNYAMSTSSFEMAAGPFAELHLAVRRRADVCAVAARRRS